jgi:DNA-binding CsgD family transcriptional regulator
MEGNNDEARACYEEALAILRVLGDRQSLALCLEGLAGVAAASGQSVAAVGLFATAAALRETIGAPLPPYYRDFYQHNLQVAREQLDEQSFAAAWAAGYATPLEQAIAGRQWVPQVQADGDAEPRSSKHPAGLATRVKSFGLSQREVDVLRLVAQGLTDAEVAERLSLSPRTINAHLRSIYSKLDVSSRSAATRSALDFNLV